MAEAHEAAALAWYEHIGERMAEATEGVDDASRGENLKVALLKLIAEGLAYWS